MKHLKGQTIYLRPTGNAARNNEGKIYTAKVVVVSRVFINIVIEGYAGEKKLRMHEHVKNRISDDVNSGYDVYETHQAALDSIEVESLAQVISEKARYQSSLKEYPIEILRKVADLLNQKPA